MITGCQTKVLALTVIVGFILSYIMMTAIAAHKVLGIDQFQISKLPRFKSSNNSRISNTPDISVANSNNTNNTYVVWEQFIFPDYRLPFICSVNSTDGDNTFSKIVNVSDSEAPNWPKIAASSGNQIFVVFELQKME